MRYFSTRNTEEKLSAAEAIVRGLAPDGGLYVPEEIPVFDAEAIRALCAMDYRQRACAVMAPYLTDFGAEELSALVGSAYADNFDCAAVAPVKFTGEGTGFLELWHGPTCAFKDMALQILPYLLTASLKKTGEEKTVCILVATSGDTGKAALEGFRDVPGTKIFVFYPRDGVSDIQKLQMITQAGANVGVCAVDGNFDDAQNGVKEIFSDQTCAERYAKAGAFLSSANSINWGRLLPQIVYYFSAYCDAVNAGEIAFGDKIVFSVPTGNFGDILAGWFAYRMGLPVSKFVCASNENNVLTDFIATGVYDRNRPFHTTISPSMDILISSNLERLLFFLSDAATVSEKMTALKKDGVYSVTPEVLSQLQGMFSGFCCDDAETKAAIKATWDGCGYLIDTHTAVGLKALKDYRAASGDESFAVVVSTASPYKFAADVCDALQAPAGDDPFLRLTGCTATAVPAPLRDLDKREVRFTDCVEKQRMTDALDAFLA